MIVHHNASLSGDIYDAKQLYAQDANYHIGKGWGHLGYSFRIARNGVVYQTVPYEEIGIHAGNYKYLKNSIGVCLDGDFTRQKPSKLQIEALQMLMNHLSYQSPKLPNITRKSWYVHGEVRLLPTACPGQDIKDLVQEYRNSDDIRETVVRVSEKANIGLIKGSLPEIYMYNGKIKFHVPDMETLKLLFPTSMIQDVADNIITKIPNGGDIPSMK